MSEGRLSQISEDEFDALIEGHIGRAAAGHDEIPADVFIDLLFERMAAKADVPIMLSIDVRGDQLMITPDQEGTDVLVKGNEVFVGGRRLVLRLAQQTD